MEAVLRKLLGLALTTILLLICVPPIYKRVRKKYSKKEQQWIGPHGTNQSVSFHRNNSVAFQPHPQNQVIQREETNAIKKKSYLSPYSALEGTTNRISSPLDNSSDSDYDLSSAQQL